MFTLMVPEEDMKRESVTMNCPECGAEFTICTKGRVMDKQANPTRCDACQAVLRIEDPQENDLNQWWAEPESQLEEEMLEKCNVSQYPTKEVGNAVRKAIKEFGPDAVRQAFERVLKGMEGKPKGPHIITNAMRSLRTHATNAAAQRSGEENLLKKGNPWLQ